MNFKMIKIVAGTLLCSTAILSAANINGDVKKIEEKVKDFSINIVNKYSKATSYTATDSEIVTTMKTGHPDSKAFLVKITLSKNGSIFDSRVVNDIVFVVDDKYITTNLFDINGSNIKGEMIFDISKKDFYNNHFLFSGDGNSSNKMLVFSDPICPFCKTEITKIHQNKKKNIDVYVLPFPLESLHPSAKIFLGIIEQMKRIGKKDMTFDIYNEKIPNNILRTSNIDKVVDYAEKAFDISINREDLKKIDMPAIEKQTELGKRLGVSKTPTIFLNGKKIR